MLSRFEEDLSSPMATQMNFSALASLLNSLQNDANTPPDLLTTALHLRCTLATQTGPVPGASLGLPGVTATERAFSWAADLVRLHPGWCSLHYLNTLILHHDHHSFLAGGTVVGSCGFV